MAKARKSKDSKQAQDKIGGILKWLWLLLIIGMLFSFAILILISYTRMPDTEELENPNYEYASIIYSSDDKEIGKYFSKNREGLLYKDINPYLVKALVATEDERFHDHSGIDARGTVRAVMFAGTKGGASTISQQLAKQFFTKRSRNIVKRIWQKLKEWAIAIQFEKRYTKEEILAMYLNKFDFIYSSHGVSAAAKTYFGKNQKDLNISESAVLIGMLKNPDLFNPKRNPDNAIQRRNIVLKQMVRNDFLSLADYEKLKSEPIDISGFNRSVHFDGMAPYFRESLKSHIKKIFEQDRYRKPDGTNYDLDEDGLKVYTTIDARMQKHAEQTMLEHMAKIQETYFSVWQDKDPWSYKASAKEEKQRKDFLNQAVRTSDRYTNMKNVMMTDIFQKIKEKYPDARLWDEDLRRMREAEKDIKYLDKLLKQDYINKKQASRYKKIIADPLWKAYKKKRSGLDNEAKRVFNLKTKMNIFDYNAKGEKSVVMSPLDSIRYHHQLMQLGSVGIDPRNGHIKTWVGGIGYKYFKYDHVKANRQVGSTFKPFLYATAIAQKGFSPCYKIKDIKHEIPAGDPNFKLLKSWAPENSDKVNTGTDWTLLDGLKKSKNSISLGLLKKMGSVEPIRKFVEMLGIPKSKIPSAPSIILGAAELSVLEMTAAYTTFANNGYYNEPTFITRIEDKDGKVIYTSVPKQRRAVSEKYNDAVVHLLKYASGNFTNQLSNPEWGGKTGTTDDYVDGWFMGISPELVIGTWVGGEYNWIRFLSIRHGSGGAMARPYYLKLMQKLERDPSINLNRDAFFKVPEGDRIVTDCSQYEKKTFHKDETDRAKKIKVINDTWDEEFQN